MLYSSVPFQTILKDVELQLDFLQEDWHHSLKA